MSAARKQDSCASGREARPPRPEKAKRLAPTGRGVLNFQPETGRLLFLAVLLERGLELVAEQIAHRHLLVGLALVLLVVRALFGAAELLDRQADAAFLGLDREDLG